jgi:4-hydroxythreonine-4-phosphate dehydrogenase
MPPTDETGKPVVAVTMGDPCGVGPEILVEALCLDELHQECLPVVVGSPLALLRAMELTGKILPIRMVRHPSELSPPNGDVLVICPSELQYDDIVYGQPTETTCRSVVGWIEESVRLAMDGHVDAVCTCPIHKANLHRFGFPFPGHTELLKHLTRAEDVVMMLAGPRLRVSLVTIHHAIADVPGLLTADRLVRTIRITAHSLMRDFGLEAPRLAVAGLNPHAGEEGRFGRQERDVIAPVVQSFKGLPYTVSGPFPADTLFHRVYQGEFDAVVAMYHDQGLIPIKLVHFYEAVNVSLGLPIVRTSADHGTAYDLAGTGKAHPGSMIAAIRLAALMARNRRSHPL